jgi:hypothetical protein
MMATGGDAPPGRGWTCAMWALIIFACAYALLGLCGPLLKWLVEPLIKT